MSNPNTTFKAGLAAQRLSYDFTEYGGLKGPIPEPSGDAVVKFREAIAATLVEHQIDPNLSDFNYADVVKAGSAVEAATIEHVGEFLGTPSTEEILAMPYRVQAAFVGWVIGTFSPEA